MDHRQHRRSIRLKGNDYSQGGAYYITVCTRNRNCLFGSVVNGQMQLNEAGQIVQSVWVGLPQFYEGIVVESFIVMPNHVHGIVIAGATVGAIRESPLQLTIPPRSGIADRRRMLLSKVVGRFKMVSAKQINDLHRSRGSALWQRNYYEHVIRNEQSLERIRQYIFENPAQWEFDHDNPVVIASGRGDS